MYVYKLDMRFLIVFAFVGFFCLLNTTTSRYKAVAKQKEIIESLRQIGDANSPTNNLRTRHGHWQKRMSSKQKGKTLRVPKKMDIDQKGHMRSRSWKQNSVKKTTH